MERAHDVAAFDRPAEPEVGPEMGAMGVQDVDDSLPVAKGDEVDTEIGQRPDPSDGNLG
jgi:hypothetical protein